MDKKRRKQLIVCLLAIVGAQVIGQNIGAKQMSLCAAGFCPSPPVATGPERATRSATTEPASGQDGR